MTKARTAKVQRQHRPATRAPHGQPEFTEGITVRLTPELLRKVKRRGGSAWVRKLIEEATP